MIRFSSLGANALLVAQGRLLIADGNLLGMGHLFAFECGTIL